MMLEPLGSAPNLYFRLRSSWLRVRVKAQRNSTVVIAGEVETDFSVVFVCHISRDSSVVKVAL